MKQKKIKRIVNILNYVFLIAFIFFIIAGIFMLVASCYFSTLPYMHPYSNHPSTNTIVSFQGREMTWNAMCFDLFILSVHMILQALITYWCRLICKCILTGQTPFQKPVVRKMQQISLALLCNDLFIWEGSFFSMNIPLDALTVLAISFIFEYGCGLQKEVDELL